MALEYKPGTGEAAVKRLAAGLQKALKSPPEPMGLMTDIPTALDHLGGVIADMEAELIALRAEVDQLKGG